MCFSQNPVNIFLHFYLDCFRIQILLKYIESLYLVLEEKRREFDFGLLWCVMRNAWCVVPDF